jgi:hypothetical protein
MTGQRRECSALASLPQRSTIVALVAEPLPRSLPLVEQDACCDASERARCCEPDDKDQCCGAARDACGCQSSDASGEVAA